MAQSVIIIGGGVAGLTAAQELAERGFRVQVFERRMVPGGKARSVPVPDSSENGSMPLPGEHGFRFFPGFYKHVPDTMRRIPRAGGGQGSVFDDLVDTTRIEFARAGTSPLVLLPRMPESLSDFKVMMQGLHEAEGLRLGLTVEDLEFFAERMWQILTSCKERRLDEYERTGWWNFLDAPNRSKAYQDYLGEGLTRSLVAAKAKLASTKTVGDIGMQLILNLSTPGENSDRVLNGPTNEVWIQPWLKYLTGLGVKYTMGAEVENIGFDNGRVTGVTVKTEGGEQTATADYYVMAVPIEVAATLLNEQMLAADPVLEGIVRLRDMTAWMNGVQFYLNEDLPLVHGHQIYLDSPWALTSLSQAQFWPNFNLQNCCCGEVRGVLSVDISDWTAPASHPDLKGKTAMECTADEISKEVWYELKTCLNSDGNEVLNDGHLHSAFLDQDIVVDKYTGKDANLEPLLVNLVNSWKDRPDAHTRIPNFFLAGDYVRTNTDLATMEAANESARRATNAILDASGSSEEHCRLWDLHEPEMLAPFRTYDRLRFEHGLPWSDPPLLKKAVKAIQDVKHELGVFEKAKASMSPAAISVAVFGVYMIILGITYVTIPNKILPLFGFATETAIHPWVRVGSAMVGVVGFYYIIAARHEYTAFLRATIWGRVGILVVFVLLITLVDSPWQLIFLAIPDQFGALWTYLALRKSTSVTADAATFEQSAAAPAPAG